MRTNGIFWLLMACFTIAQAQQRDYWSPHTGTAERIVKAKGVNRLTFPTSFQLFDLYLQTLQPELMGVVNSTSQPRKFSTVISLPNANGNLEEFEVYECSNFEPALQARFPNIRAFSGRGITDQAATLKLSISPTGIQTMVFRAGRETEFIEPYSRDRRVYAIYRRKREARQLPWRCTTVEKQMVTGLTNQVVAIAAPSPSPGVLRTLRLAQSCNGEYANYFGAFNSTQLDSVMIAFNNTLTRCNGVYEKDLALHLNLISRTTEVIYYDPKSDPYSLRISNWNSQLQKTLTNIIGETNYDIGHLFGASGGGGNAGCIGCVCADGSKGSGITSPADGIPEGDNFDIDYVIHEVGHQLGANHTFSMSNEGTGQNKEVGSGITIMGYAGITSQDVARHSIDIFHETSIKQILDKLNTKDCPQQFVISKTNSAPTVTTDKGAYTIPLSTPFALTATASDNERDPLTYCWEQDDNASSAQTGSSSVAAPAKTPGPNWISFPPTTTPTRLFPQLSTILAGNTITGPLPGGDAGTNTEALSSVSRDLNFRLTVRDNHPSYISANLDSVSVGQIAFADVTVTVANLGPFAITSHNTPSSWTIGEAQTVTWDVNNTNLSPISCTTVNILLSIDSGQTFSSLASAIPNNGSASVTIPKGLNPTNKARIKVEAVGNIFFDINNANISLTSCAAPGGLATTGLDTSTATVSWTALPNAQGYLLNYKLSSTTTWISQTTTNTSEKLINLTPGSLYDWRVKTICGTGDSSVFSTAQFTTLTPPCKSAYDTTANNTTGGAKPIPFATDIKGLISPSGDVDNYKITTNSTGTLILSLTTLPANYNLKLLSSAGTQLAISQNNGTLSESISYNVTSSTLTDYFVQVFGKGNANNANSCYTLNVSFSGTVKPLANSGASPAAETAGSLKIFPNPASSMLQLYGRGWTTSAEAEIYQINGRKVFSQILQPGWMTMDISRLIAGVYILRIQNPSGAVQELKFVKQ